eukprot:24020-Rhodomonas_salina.1
MGHTETISHEGTSAVPTWDYVRPDVGLCPSGHGTAGPDVGLRGLGQAWSGLSFSAADGYWRPTEQDRFKQNWGPNRAECGNNLVRNWPE